MSIVSDRQLYTLQIHHLLIKIDDMRHSLTETILKTKNVQSPHYQTSLPLQNANLV
jgi:hypothetical protein